MGFVQRFFEVARDVGRMRALPSPAEQRPGFQQLVAFTCWLEADPLGTSGLAHYSGHRLFTHARRNPRLRLDPLGTRELELRLSFDHGEFVGSTSYQIGIAGFVAD